MLGRQAIDLRESGLEDGAQGGLDSEREDICVPCNAHQKITTDEAPK